MAYFAAIEIVEGEVETRAFCDYLCASDSNYVEIYGGGELDFSEYCYLCGKVVEGYLGVHRL